MSILKTKARKFLLINGPIVAKNYLIKIKMSLVTLARRISIGFSQRKSSPSGRKRVTCCSSSRKHTWATIASNLIKTLRQMRSINYPKTCLGVCRRGSGKTCFYQKNKSCRKKRTVVLRSKLMGK